MDDNVGNDVYICNVKRQFHTEQEALIEMKFLKNDKKYKKLKRAYICSNCHLWHLTSKPWNFVDENKRSWKKDRKQRIGKRRTY